MVADAPIAACENRWDKAAREARFQGSDSRKGNALWMLLQVRFLPGAHIFATVTHQVECLLRKQDVAGSSPAGGSRQRISYANNRH